MGSVVASDAIAQELERFLRASGRRGAGMAEDGGTTAPSSRTGGRYASLPKEIAPDALSLEQALGLLDRERKVGGKGRVPD